MSEVDSSSPTMASRPTAEMKSPAPGKQSEPSRLGGFLRRALFVILLLAVLIGIGVAGWVLNRRLAAATARNAALQTEVDSLSTKVESMEGDLDEQLDQALKAQAAEYDTALATLEADTDYVTLLLRAQNQAAKAQLDLSDENFADARSAINALRDTLTAAAELASDDDAGKLDEMQSRLDLAEGAIVTDSLTARDDLDSVWRGLDALVAAQLAPE